MAKLFQLFVDIALWRRGPQDLPASTTLLWLVFVCYVAVTVPQAVLVGLSFNATARLIVMEFAIWSASVWLLLAFFSRRQRFIQTLIAVMGVRVLLMSLDLLVMIVQQLMSPGAGVPDAWILISFLATAVIMGRILMLAIDGQLFTGMALTVAIIFSTEALAELFVRTA